MEKLSLFQPLEDEKGKVKVQLIVSVQAILGWKCERSRKTFGGNRFHQEVWWFYGNARGQTKLVYPTKRI